MLGPRLAQANRIAARRRALRVGWFTYSGGVQSTGDDEPVGVFRKWNMTCPCYGCHHARSGRTYKRKGWRKARLTNLRFGQPELN
jgi:hypothetical protein